MICVCSYSKIEVLLLLGKMQSDSGKLFIGGISWDTNEERLKEYFSAFGEVVEAVIMKDRTTGRARGFGFVVFADPTVADTVIMEKHNIDGRLVILVLHFNECSLTQQLCVYVLVIAGIIQFHITVTGIKL